MKYTTKRRQNFTFTCTSPTQHTSLHLFLLGHEWSARCWQLVVICELWLPTGVAFINHKTITRSVRRGPSGSNHVVGSAHVARLLLPLPLLAFWESAPTRVLCSLGSESRRQSSTSPFPPPANAHPFRCGISSVCFLIDVFSGKIHVYKRLAAYYLFMYVSCNWISLSRCLFSFSSSSSISSRRRSVIKIIIIIINSSEPKQIANFT